MSIYALLAKDKNSYLIANTRLLRGCVQMKFCLLCRRLEVFGVHLIIISLLFEKYLSINYITLILSVCATLEYETITMLETK